MKALEGWKISLALEAINLAVEISRSVGRWWVWLKATGRREATDASKNSSNRESRRETTEERRMGRDALLQGGAVQGCMHRTWLGS